VGYWGVKSYEVDEAHDALDTGFDRVHGSTYDDLMDDRNPLTLEQVQAKLANADTLAASVAALEVVFGPIGDDYEDEARLGLVGVVVRHAELGVPIPPAWRDRAVAWLEGETLDWDEPTKRRLRRERELETLRKAALAP